MVPVCATGVPQHFVSRLDWLISVRFLWSQELQQKYPKLLIINFNLLKKQREKLATKTKLVIYTFFYLYFSSSGKFSFENILY